MEWCAGIKKNKVNLYELTWEDLQDILLNGKARIDQEVDMITFMF